MREILFRGKTYNDKWVQGFGFSAPDMTITEFIEDELTTIVEAEVSE